MRTAIRRIRAAAIGAALLGWGVAAVASAADPGPSRPDAADGRELFHREWLPDDPRSRGGDGLGPVYNDTSCVACHNLGGPGGAGPVGKNIDILALSRSPIVAPPADPSGGTPPSPPGLDQLMKLHAGFRSSGTVVLHRFGVDPSYEPWRQGILSGRPSLGFVDELLPLPVPPRFTIGGEFVEGLQVVEFVDLASDGLSASAGVIRELQQARAAMRERGPVGPDSRFAVGAFEVTRSQRNPTALFGIGLVDSIPDGAIEAMADRHDERFPEVEGRVARLADGRIGRFGWKGQLAGIDDFVRSACAVELGLEVPGHNQGVVPQAPRYRPDGPDLSAEDCDELSAYIRDLPRPVARPASSPAEAEILASGRTLFGRVGCASCHAPRLGDVDGLFSDLLLHDMGASLADEGSYGSDDDPLPPFHEIADAGDGADAGGRAAPATRREWRTPPLWGLRDSAPYLHDGRAQTIAEAIAGHGGEAERSAQMFFELLPRERLTLEAFLKSLVAPEPDHG